MSGEREILWPSRPDVRREIATLDVSASSSYPVLREADPLPGGSSGSLITSLATAHPSWFSDPSDNQIIHMPEDLGTIHPLGVRHAAYAHLPMQTARSRPKNFRHGGTKTSERGQQKS